MSTASLSVILFFFFFFCPCYFLSSQSWWRKRALVTLPTPISLETDEAAFLFLFLPSSRPSSLVFHTNPPPCDEPNVQKLLPHMHRMGFERDGCVFELCDVCERVFANIGVKGRGHTDHRLRGQHRRESNYVYCTKQKHTGQPLIWPFSVCLCQFTAS